MTIYIPEHESLRPQPVVTQRKPKAWPILLLSLVIFTSGWFTVYLYFDRSLAVAPPTTQLPDWVESVDRVAIAEVGEDPGLAAQIPGQYLRFCDSMSELDTRTFQEAQALMRATDEGQQLFQTLLDNGVCLTTEEIAYNSAYTRIIWSPDNGWSDSRIVVSTRDADHLYPDMLAAILVHEATHMQRAIDGTACYAVDDCTMLNNGIELEEEIAAHKAEVQWWIAMYGDNGKRFSFNMDRAENALMKAYLKGDDAFAEYVAQMRSNPREGEGL